MLMEMRASIRLAALALMLVPALSGAAFAQGDLDLARRQYNAGLFDEAIASVAGGRYPPKAAASAALVSARARLERFRRGGDGQDLAQARAALATLNPRELPARDAIEWQIGVGEALFLEGEAGPASQMFASVLAPARRQLTPAEFDKLFEWWAAATARFAETLAGAERLEQFGRMAAALKPFLDGDAPSREAIYWWVVAVRGVGDLDGAWNAALAGWIRADLWPDTALLRADLEQFVLQTLIPERAQAKVGQRLDTRAAIAEIAVMTDAWRAITLRWSAED